MALIIAASCARSGGTVAAMVDCCDSARAVSSVVATPLSNRFRTSAVFCCASARLRSAMARAACMPRSCR